MPAGLKAMSNGRLLGITRKGGRKTFAWRESKPMSTYLAVVDIGRGKLTRGQIGNAALLDAGRPRARQALAALR